MADWPGIGGGRTTSGQPDSNSWGHQRENDTSDVVRRGVQYESITAGQIIKYGNADRLYLMSATTAGNTTVVFGSATNNTGAEYVVRNRTAGNVIVSTTGGTMIGSATQSSAGAISIWRSDGSDWLRLFNSDSVISNPFVVNDLTVQGSATMSGTVTLLTALNVSGTLSVGGASLLNNLTVAGSATMSGTVTLLTALNVSGTLSVGGASLLNNLTVAGSATFSGTVAFLTAINVSGTASAGIVTVGTRFSVKGSSSFSGSVIFLIQPNFPNGAVTSITGGASIVHAGNVFYEISAGASNIQLILPDPATVMGQRRSVKFLSGGTGLILLSSAAGRINPTASTATACATITMSALASWASFVAGQTDWWIV